MKKNTIIFLVAAIAALFISGCCCKDKEQEITVLAFASSRDAEYNFAGRKYLFLIYKQGEDYFFQSHIPDYTEKDRTVFSRNLGKNVGFISNWHQFENGRMSIEYCDSNEKWHKVEVPFGDFYGDKHVSQVKPVKELPTELSSEKYYPAGILKRDEPAVENILPTLQKHLRNNDADAISKMIIYPAEIRVPDIDICYLETRDDFLKYYPQIFTEEVKKNILESQNKDIICTSEGLRFEFFPIMWFRIGIDGKAYFGAIK